VGTDVWMVALVAGRVLRKTTALQAGVSNEIIVALKTELLRKPDLKVKYFFMYNGQTSMCGVNVSKERYSDIGALPYDVLLVNIIYVIGRLKFSVLL
jgi:hypothetical protein